MSLRRVSLAPDGSQWNTNSFSAALSADGHYIAYTLYDDTSDSDDRDVFIFDMDTEQTEQIALTTDGNEPNGFLETPSISNDGRFIAFDGVSSNLVAEDTNDACDFSGDQKYDDNCRDVYLYDREAGMIQRVSSSPTGFQIYQSSMVGRVSGDGSIVAFASAGTGLVSSDLNGSFDIFIKDPESGETTRIVNDAGEEGNHNTGMVGVTLGLRSAFDLSDDGRYIVFASLASNFVEGDLNAGACDPRFFATLEPQCNDVFIYDRETGEITLISAASKER